MLAEARGQRLYLVPIGPENEHQRTLDGELPEAVAASTELSVLLPCWGVTEGNLMARTGGAHAGDGLAVIRAESKYQPAIVHRLAVLGGLARNAQAAGRLYTQQHNYHMGEHCTAF